MNEALVEHQSARQPIAGIRGLAGDDPMLKANAMVLCEYINHHVREEENEMLPKVRRLKLDLEGLAQKMLARREELKGQS